MNKIKSFWKKGKWQKFAIIFIIFLILGVIADLAGFTYVYIKEIKVDDINIKVGEESKINFTIEPDNYEVEIISTEYKIDDEEIAKMNNDKVMGLSEGETTVEVIIKDDHENTTTSKKATIKVDLTDAQKKEKEEAEKIAKQNSISDSEAIRIRDHSKDIINSILKSPSTAEYPDSFLNPLNDWSMVKKNNLVTVSSYVDAQNSFGATIRSKFVIQVKMNDDGSGKATYVELDGDVVTGKYQK